MLNITKNMQAAKIEDEKNFSRRLENQRCHTQAASKAGICSARPTIKAIATVPPIKTFPLDGGIELRRINNRTQVASEVKAATNMVFSQGFI
jgi:hypothetical protein